MRSLASVSLLALALAGTASAQDAATTAAQPAPEAVPDAETGRGNEIIVTAERLPGQVQTDSPPVLELNEQEVAAYGATSIADLVAQLAPQTGSGRGRGGRPVFLINGQRVSNFREMGRFPPEAIRKVEVLPEEVALKFGYPPDARVINFILKPDFASREIEGEFGMPVAGGYSAQELEGGILKIDGARRISAQVNYNRRSPLTEGERNIVQVIPTDPAVAAAGLDPADFRTLVSREESITGNATLTQGLGEMGSGGQLTLNTEVSRVVRDSLSGIDPITLDAIDRKTSTDSYSLGAAYNRDLGGWRMSNTFDGNRTDSDSRIDQRGGGGTDRSLSRTYTADLKTTLAGSPFTLPGGEANLTLDAGYKWNSIESSDTRSATGEFSLDRSRTRAGASLSVPITSTREGFLDAIGDFSVNFGGGVDHLSDFGTLTDWNAGATWRPTERLTLQGSYVTREVAPSLSQLGNPQIVDVNVPVYDFSTGNTVFATVTTGGNPDLKAETQRDLKLSAAYDFDLFDRANFMVEYFRNNSNDTTEGFPLLTPAIEAAFPGRVTRAADGTLLSVDRRPVTFAARKSSRIRYGVNLFGRVGKASPEGQGQRGGFGGAAPAAAAPASAPASTPAPAATPAPTGPTAPGGPGSQRGGFDPARFAEMQAKFCAAPAGQVPDLSGVPPQMLERLKGPDGQVDPARVAMLRSRFCNADGTPNTQAGPGGPRTFDPARFAALRTALACGVEGKEPDLAALPPEVAERLKGTDGKIDPARLAELRTRICAIPAPPAQPAGQAAAGPGGNPGGGGGPGGGRPRGGGMMGMMGGGDGQGRWNLSLYHSIELDSTAQIAAVGPVLDLLDGDALGESGVSRHTVQLEGGVFRNGIGLRASGNYRSPTTVRGSGLPGSSDLRFGSLTTFDLRMFMNLEQQKWLTGEGEPGFWKGTRMGLRVNNVFDTRQKVTDDTGTVPLRYQPGLIDPTGRYFEIELRKMF